MPRTGRPRKPIEQKVREGNPGEHALPAPLVLSATAPTKPATLGVHGAELWDDLVAALDSLGITQSIDRAALTALCAQWDVAEMAREILRLEGLFAVGSTGQLVEHPAVKMMHRAHRMVVAIASEFGATAAARARIAASLSDAMRARDDGELADVLDLDEADIVEIEE